MSDKSIAIWHYPGGMAKLLPFPGMPAPGCICRVCLSLQSHESRTTPVQGCNCDACVRMRIAYRDFWEKRRQQQEEELERFKRGFSGMGGGH